MSEGFAIAFGRVANPALAVAAEGRELALAGTPLGRQVALIDPGTPAFRLNSPGWLNVAPETVPALATPASLRELCRRRLGEALPPFSRAAARFVAAYLDAVVSTVAPPPSPEQARAGVSAPGDRFFDALLPLANAWIAPGVPDRAAGNPEGEDFAQADVAFWTGDALIAVVLSLRSNVIGRRRRALDRLAEVADLRWWPDDHADAEALAALALTAPPPAGEASFGPLRNPTFATLPE